MPGENDTTEFGPGLQEPAGAEQPGAGAPDPGTVPTAGTVPPDPSSAPLPSDAISSDTAALERLEAEVASEQGTPITDYGADPGTPGTPATGATFSSVSAQHSDGNSGDSDEAPAHAQVPETASNQTAPTDMRMDNEGDPEKATAPTSDVIGDPNADASQWTFQGENGYCGPNSISMLLESSTGVHMTEQQVASWAISNGEMVQLPASDEVPGQPTLGYGMLPSQVAATLNALGGEYGVSATLESGNLGDLESSLKSGHEVLIELDDQRIWHQQGVTDTDEANHYVVVTGIDPSTGTVFINDPGDPDGKEESIPLKEFESAWSTSENAMIVISKSGGSADPSTPSTPSTASTPSTSESGGGDGGGGTVLLPVTIDGRLVNRG